VLRVALVTSCLLVTTARADPPLQQKVKQPRDAGVVATPPPSSIGGVRGRVEHVDVKGGIHPDAVVRMVHFSVVGAAGCASAIEVKQPTVVSFEADVSAAGDVTAARVSGAPPGLSECVKAALMKQKLPATSVIEGRGRFRPR